MNLVIVALLLLGSVARADTPPALTAEEAARYVRERPDEAAADVMRLEAIERAAPVLTTPTLVIIETKDGRLRAYWDPGPVLGVDVADELHYRITLPEASAPGPGPPLGLGGYLVAGGIGLLAGGALVWLVSR